jgi:hypothetical protein
MSAMYVSFWKNFGRLDFTPNWRSVNSINPKWKSWVTSTLKMAFAWILARFRPNVVDWVTPIFVQKCPMFS